MNWYLAKIVFRIICGNGRHEPQFDEQLRLISAANKQEAIQKANGLGLADQQSFRNEEKELVRWEYVAVPEVYRFGALIHGATLFERNYEPSDGDAYARAIRRKALALKKGEKAGVHRHAFIGI